MTSSILPSFIFRPLSGVHADSLLRKKTTVLHGCFHPRNFGLNKYDILSDFDLTPCLYRAFIYREE